MNALPSSALIIHFKDYEQYHQTTGNKSCHFIGVPLVLFSLLGLLSKVVLWKQPDSLFQIDLGVGLLIIGAIFSLRMDFKLSIPYLLYVYFNYLIARHLSLPILFGIQALAWAIQFWGHYRYEKKAPALFTTLSHAFVGPMWVFSWVVGYYRPTLR